MLSHKNFSTMMDIWDKHCVDHFIPKIGDGNWDYHKENFLLFLPFHHIFGFGSMNHILSNGATGIVFSKFDPTVFLEAIQMYKPKMVILVPPLLLFLTKHPMTAKYDLSSVQLVFTGAAPVGKDLGEEFLKKYQHVRYLAQAYGLTECSKGTHFPPLDSRDEFSNVGMLVSSLEQKIASETGEALPLGEVGEVCIRGPTIMKGYLGCPDVTAQTIDSEGWLHTGDIGFLDDKGQLYIVDRLKELIKVKGLQQTLGYRRSTMARHVNEFGLIQNVVLMNTSCIDNRAALRDHLRKFSTVTAQVAPSELEDILLSHEDISDAAVIGVPDEKHGELPRAYVVRTNESLTEVDVQRFIQGKVSSHKHLTGGVVFVSNIPKSPSGKILRRILRDQFQKEMSSEPH